VISKKVHPRFRADPDSRRLIVSAWNGFRVSSWPSARLQGARIAVIVSPDQFVVISTGIRAGAALASDLRSLKNVPRPILENFAAMINEPRQPRWRGLNEEIRLARGGAPRNAFTVEGRKRLDRCVRDALGSDENDADPL
jgi:hypothetical protein